MRLLIIGDTHGNTDWVRYYVYPVAIVMDVDAIIQLGDFGAWEHTSGGLDFMNDVGHAAYEAGKPLYWLHGNHDKHSQTLRQYKPDKRGFRPCRDLVFYIPQGHAWQWEGVRMRSFGGAYSVDKDWRVRSDRQRGREEYLWFPEEEMTDDEMTRLLAKDDGKKEIVFSHDKPYSSKPGWNRKDIAACVPNQIRLERALRAHKPEYWFHGHLHYFYRDTLRGFDYQSEVIGLDPDGDAAEHQWQRTHTWAIADLVAGKVTVKTGDQVFVDPEALRSARDKMR